jgi:hypothetical protein
MSCWALFDRAMFGAIGEPQQLNRDDPDLKEVARLFDLTVPEAQPSD